jgi:hypothetical protein
MYRDIVHTTRYLQEERLSSIRPTTVRRGHRSPMRQAFGAKLIAMGRRLVGEATTVTSTPVRSGV